MIVEMEVQMAYGDIMAYSVSVDQLGKESNKLLFFTEIVKIAYFVVYNPRKSLSNYRTE
jgi:hypothetical protein